MKKISFVVLMGILVAGTASAEFQEPVQAAPTAEPTVNAKGGFVGGAETIVTVKQVNEMRDDVPVIVKGNIVQRMGDEKYLFEDATGAITVEIDDDNWRGQTVKPTDTVKMYGEVDRGLRTTEIDVDYIEKM
ncbi:MAG: YgiW/YdeI family stress tolerance OB fold protein [Alphaproteobacteria bacterium]|nr:YgiW/YdeI family stress tolerance OB fold protein [Alphaproteobacteria bacterium]